MPTTYEPIATTTLGSAAATVTFSSIPGTYTDLILIIRATLSSSSGAMGAQLNSDTGSNYSYTRLTGNGSSASSDRNTSLTFAPIGTVSTTQNVSIIHFQNYANSTTYKTLLTRNGIADVATYGIVALWRNTAAITSILINNNAGVNYASGSTFTLYGIKAA